MYEFYAEESQKLRNIGKNLHLTDTDIDRIIDESFKFLETEYANKKVSTKCSLFKKKNVLILSVFIAVLAFLFVFTSYQRKSIYGYIVRNFQVLVYPAMKYLRKIMLPVIEKFPALTELYDEACLVGNPYFQVSDIDCWPCENVKTVLNLTIANLSNEEYHSGIPFIYRDGKLKEVNYEKLIQMYRKKRSIFDNDACKIQNSSSGFTTPKELFLNRPMSSHPSSLRDSHLAWKLNRLEPVREIRQLFGVPGQVPSYVSGATIEKWLLIDEPNSPPYQLPWTEGTTVFVIQGSGSRLISLEPSAECAASCHRVSILLRPNHILWYNWWYWRGKSLPVDTSNKLSITYIGSFY